MISCRLLFCALCVCPGIIFENVSALGELGWDKIYATGMKMGYNYMMNNAQDSEAAKSAKSAIGDLFENTGKVLDSIDEAVKDATKNFNEFSGICDGHCLVEELTPKLELNKLPKQQCIKGLQINVVNKGMLKLTNGNLIPKRVTREAKTKETKEDKKQKKPPAVNISLRGELDGSAVTIKDTHVIILSLEFRELLFAFKFVFNDASSGIINNAMKVVSGSTRKGTIKAVIQGSTFVNLRVRVAQKKTDVQKGLKEGKCFVKIREKFSVHLGGKIKYSVDYDSASNAVSNGVKRKTLLEILSNKSIEDEIKSEIRRSLRKMVESIFSKDTIFCDTYRIKVEGFDCKEVTDVGDRTLV